MDPLSVTASIVGILAAAAKISESLHSTISTAKDAPRVMFALDCEVREIQAALSTLQNLLADLSSAPLRRTALIQLDHLIVTLTECGLTLVELKLAIAPYATLRGTKVPLRTRLRWTRFEADCLKIVERLQRHKSSISLMLNILQCASDADANRSQSTLETMVAQLLQNDEHLFDRLKNLEDSLDARSALTPTVDRRSFVSQTDDATITTKRASSNKADVLPQTIRIRFEFDEALQASRVYRMVKNNNYPHSLTSSTRRTQTWSIFTGLSLADISNISVVALPLYAKDFGDEATADSLYEFKLLRPMKSVSDVADHDNSFEPFELKYPSLRNESRDKDMFCHFQSDFTIGTVLCTSCSEPVGEKMAYELNHTSWHEACFRCWVCKGFLDCHSKVLTFHTDSIIGYQCEFDHDNCGSEQQARLLVTESDQREFHKTLFGCPLYRDSPGIIQTAIYSQGIVCWDCSESARSQFPTWIDKALLAQRIRLPPPALPFFSEDENLD